MTMMEIRALRYEVELWKDASSLQDCYGLFFVGVKKTIPTGLEGQVFSWNNM